LIDVPINPAALVAHPPVRRSFLCLNLRGAPDFSGFCPGAFFPGLIRFLPTTHTLIVHLFPKIGA